MQAFLKISKNTAIFFLLLSLTAKAFAAGDTVKINTGYGPEDIAIDSAYQRLFISCDNRRNDALQGQIWVYETKTETSRNVLFETPLMFDFHPHGIFICTVNDSSYLYVINHISKNNSEIDRFLILEYRLKLDKRFTDISGKPNDLVVKGKDEFYYTDYKTLGGSIIHYKNGEETKIIKGLKMPNGIILKGETLYFTTTLNGTLYKTSLNDIRKESVCKLKGSDNIMETPDGNFLIASHQKFGKFMKHAKYPSKFSPSLVYRVDPQTGEKDVVFADDGRVISAVSTAVLYNGNLYLGQVFDGFMLVIKGLND